MNKFVWNKMKHDVKVEKLNDQHKMLFDTLDKLYKAMEDKSDKNALAKVIDELILYSKEHLMTEEALLEKYNYPGIAQQKEQHKIFIEKVLHFREEFATNNNFMLYFNMAVFLKNWIANHIQEIDRLYSDFLNERGVY